MKYKKFYLIYIFAVNLHCVFYAAQYVRLDDVNQKITRIRCGVKSKVHHYELLANPQKKTILFEDIFGYVCRYEQHNYDGTKIVAIESLKIDTTLIPAAAVILNAHGAIVKELDGTATLADLKSRYKKNG